MSNEKVFANGFSFKRRESAPDFVIGNISIKVDDAIEFLKANKKQDGWVNLNILKSQSGKPYIELDTWSPESTPKVETPAEMGGDLPF
jgi:hypothetical protein